MSFDKKLANAAGGKTARACDNCIRKRARWFCAADDAFLCQACDTAVHSANPLACRHERVRLKTASDKPSDRARVENSEPSWHQGFTRKPRTRRPHSKVPALHQQPLPFVPELDADETSHDENESSITQTVPIFEPLGIDGDNEDAARSDSKALFPDYGHEVDDLRGFFESEMDLAEFAADVESLLGKGLDEIDSFGMEALGLLDCEEKDSMEGSSGSGRVKTEDEEDMEIYVTREPFELNFDYDSPVNDEVDHKMENEEMGLTSESGASNVSEENMSKKKICLRLNHEAVIAAWTSQGSPFPWTAEERPDINADHGWPDFMGGCEIDVHGMGRMGGQMGLGDGGREARVSRYREKRRTRLFSKKIRYEVRKLNAEKRPRMKGRFVKRTTLMAGSYGGGHVFPLINK